jgi:hypothetical protein
MENTNMNNDALVNTNDALTLVNTNDTLVNTIYRIVLEALDKENFNYVLMSDEINSLALALSKAQGALENVGKDKQGYGYKYADLASVLNAAKKPLSDNGLSVSQLVTEDKDNKPVLITFLLHESGQWLKSIFRIEYVIVKNKQGIVTGNSLQHFGAGLTYCRRYALSAIIGLSQDDDDGHSLGNRTSTEETKAKEGKIADLLELCDTHKLNIKEFAKFHNIDSNNIETVINGIDNFILFKEKFLNAKNTNTQ